MRIVKLSKPYINQEAINGVIEVLQSGWLTQGPKVALFEESFKKYLGASCALAVNSATSGLHIALLSLGVGVGDEVILPSFTWVATANVVEQCGAKPVFVDIDLATFNTNLDQVLSKISEKTKAIIIVHLFGKPFDIEELKIKLPRSIPIIEDAACAAGASINNQYCGMMGNVGVYSFHPRKSITTGEGGMVVTNINDIYKKMNMLRNHGQDVSYKEETPSFMFDCPIVGFNYRMTDFQAVLGLEQFKDIDKLIQYRDSLASRYYMNLNKILGIALPIQENMEKHSWQSYVILILDLSLREKIMLGLTKFGIETRPGTHAVHLLKYYKDRYDLNPEDFPCAYQAFRSSIALPLHNGMTIEDIDYVSEKLAEVIYALQ